MKTTVLHIVLIALSATADNPPATLWSEYYTFAGHTTWSAGMVLLDDGSFVISGPYLVASGDMDSYLIAVNSDGSQEWQNSTGGIAGHAEFVTNLIQTENGDFIQAGYDFWNGDYTALVIRTNSVGDSLSVQTYSEGSYVFAIAELPNGNILVSGRLDSSGENLGWLAEIDGNEDLLWSKHYGQPGIETSLSDFEVLADNTILACGRSDGFRYLQKTDSDGDTLWTQTDMSSEGSFTAIEALPEGGFILAGYDYEGVPESRSAFLCCFDENGTVEWEGNYSGKYEWSANDVQRCLDGGYLVCGSKSSSASNNWGLAFRTDSQGELVWEYGYGSPGDIFSTCVVLPSGGYCLHGMAISVEPDAAWLLRLDTETGIENPDFSDETTDIMTVLSSNPLEGELSVSVDIPICTPTQMQLYNISGRVVCTALNETLHPGLHNFTIPTESLSKGIYLIRIDAGGITETETVIILN